MKLIIGPRGYPDVFAATTDFKWEVYRSDMNTKSMTRTYHVYRYEKERVVYRIAIKANNMLEFAQKLIDEVESIDTVALYSSDRKNLVAIERPRPTPVVKNGQYELELGVAA